MPEAGRLKQQTFMSQFWTLGSPRARSWPIQGPMRGSFLADRWPPSRCVFHCGTDRALWSLSLLIRAPLPIWGSTLMTSPKPGLFPKAPPPNVTLRVRTSARELWGTGTLSPQQRLTMACLFHVFSLCAPEASFLSPESLVFSWGTCFFFLSHQSLISPPC